MLVSLESWRDQIDAVDRELIALFNRRAELALRLGQRKREAGLALLDRRREEEVLARARRQSSGPLSAAAVDRLFRAILAESRRAQSQLFEGVGRSRRSKCA